MTDNTKATVDPDPTSRSNGHIQATWEAPNGLKVQLLHVSSFVIMAAGKKIRIPEPPVLYDPDKDRSEENPLDPDYLKEKADAEELRALAILGAFLTFGTKIIKEPPDLMPFDDSEWIGVVEDLLGERVPSNLSLRRLMWMKYVALNDPISFNELLTAITRFNKRVSEEDVKDAEDAFRSSERRRAIDGVVTPPKD